LRANADRLRLNRRLTTLNLSLPTLAPAAIPKQDPNRPALFAFLEEMAMKSARAEAESRYNGQIELF